MSATRGTVEKEGGGKVFIRNERLSNERFENEYPSLTQPHPKKRGGNGPHLCSAPFMTIKRRERPVDSDTSLRGGSRGKRERERKAQKI